MSIAQLVASPVKTLLVSLVLLAAGLGLVSDRALATPTAGVQLHLLWDGVSDDEVDDQLDRAQRAGAGILRVDVGWGSLQEQGPGRWNAYHLHRLDAVVAKANERDVDLLLTLADSPCWASSAPARLKAGCRGRWWERDVQRYLPRDPRLYADALAFLADRYGSKVRAWEMWNEPNQEFFSHGPRKADRYAALVQAAYPRAKAAAPDATFVAGAVSEADTGFVEAFYRAGAAGSFDALSLHPYSQDVSPLDPRLRGNRRLSFATGVPAVRDVMLRHGDDGPLWLTEFGWSTNRVRGAGPWRDGVDERVQATYIRQALAKVTDWSYVPVIVYYNLVDRSADRTSAVDNYGLVRHDGSPKPGFAAFRDAARALQGRGAAAPGM